MNITKKGEKFGIDVGFVIDLSRDEYNDIMEAVDAAAEWNEENGNYEESAKCRALYEKMDEVKNRYLTDDETKAIRDCFCCKNCLPPFQRTKGMCKLTECKFVPA